MDQRHEDMLGYANEIMNETEVLYEAIDDGDYVTAVASLFATEIGLIKPQSANRVSQAKSDEAARHPTGKRWAIFCW